MVELCEVRFSYEKDLPVLNQLSLALKQGEIYGLLGPNGAGKSTTFGLILGRRQPETGEVRVWGMDPWSERHALAKRWGVISEGGALYPRLTLKQNLEFFAELYPEIERQRLEQIIERMGLGEHLHKKAENLSTGLKQRGALARCIFHQPELLILDEPFAGVDIHHCKILEGMLRELAGEGVTIFLTTHNFLRAARLCDRIGFLGGGSLLSEGSSQSLIKKAPEGDLELLHLNLLEELESV